MIRQLNTQELNGKIVTDGILHRPSKIPKNHTAYYFMSDKFEPVTTLYISPNNFISQTKEEKDVELKVTVEDPEIFDVDKESLLKLDYVEFRRLLVSTIENFLAELLLQQYWKHTSLENRRGYMLNYRCKNTDQIIDELAGKEMTPEYTDFIKEKYPDKNFIINELPCGFRPVLYPDNVDVYTVCNLVYDVHIH